MSKMYFVGVFALILVLSCFSVEGAYGRNVTDADRRPVVGEQYVEPPPPLPPEMVDDLKSYAIERLRKHYVSAREIYNSDEQGFEGLEYIRLTPVPAAPILSGDLAVYCGDLEGLAVMDRKGNLRVWGKYPCQGLRMSGGPAKQLAMGKDSPWLAALAADGSTIRMVDLAQCGPANIWLKARDKTIENMVVSGDGDWIAVVTSDHSVFAGPALGPLKEAARFQKPVAMIGFTVYEGVLVVVAEDGDVVFWGLRPGKKVGDAKINEKFKSVSFVGDTLLLKNQDGDERAWNVISRRFVEYNATRPDNKSANLELKNGVMSLDTGLERWKKTVFFQIPQLVLRYSSSANSLQLDDVDGKTRYYDELTGNLTQPVEADDWKLLEKDEDGFYTVGSSYYRVTDVACQKGYDSLICRYIPGVGFFTWWDVRQDSRKYIPHPNALPARKSLLSTNPPEWIDLRQGRLP